MLWHSMHNHCYVGSADLPSDSLRKNLAWWAVTRRTLKNHKTVKIWGWALARVWALARTILYKFNTVTYWAALVWCSGLVPKRWCVGLRTRSRLRQHVAVQSTCLDSMPIRPFDPPDQSYHPHNLQFSYQSFGRILSLVGVARLCGS